MYYFATIENMGKEKILKPRIPESKMLDEENTTERICVSQSIIGCLSAIGNNIHKNDIINIYSCKSNNAKQAIKKNVYDCSITGEIWITKPVKMKFYKQIKIMKKHYFSVNNEIGTICICEFKEIT